MEKNIVKSIETKMAILFENTILKEVILPQYIYTYIHTYLSVSVCVRIRTLSQLMHRYNHSNKYVQNCKVIILSVAMIFG